MEIRFASSGSLTPVCREKMKEAVSRVFGDDPVRMVRSEPGPGVVGFGIDSGIRTLGPREIEEYPTAVGFLTHAFSRLKPVVPLVPWDCDPTKILYLDIETHNAGKQFSMPARDFFRLGQYAWGPTGEVIVTTDYDEVIEAIRLAEGVIAHNGHNFDFSVLFGADSTEALQMALDGKLFDTMVFAALACPAPDVYVNRAGVTQYVKKPEMALKWLSLDNLCYQLGTDGKEGNLKELAARHNPKGTRVSDLDYSLIPLDDPDFLAYAVQDVKSLQELTNALLTLATPSDYDWREQLNAAIDAQNTRNGLRVDVPKAKARVEELRVRREALMADLESRYGFPTEGKMPWRTNPGKEAILKALADVGVTPETHPDWPKTKTGNISLGGEALVDLTSGTQAAELGQALAELMGQRSLAQLALDSVHPDGRVHPQINALQRSGRRSVTQPGLTVWSAKGKGAVEKSYFVASEGRKLVELDYSQADARIVAALSGDAEFAKRFEPGADAHDISGRLFFGGDRYAQDRENLRPIAKACIAEGELVDTDHGLVPIEKVTTEMRVWDGENFVMHRGTVYSGVKPVITYDGLTATEDHIVFIRDNDGELLEVPFGIAAACHYPVASSREGGRDARGVRDHESGQSVRGVSEVVLRGGSVHPMRIFGVGSVHEPDTRSDGGVRPVLSTAEATVPELVGPTHGGSSPTVRESQESEFQELRREGDSVRVSDRPGRLPVRLDPSRTLRSDDDARPDRHEPGVRAGESSTGDIDRADGEQAEHGSLRVSPGTLALRSRDSDSIPVAGVHPRADHRGGSGGREDKGFASPSRPRETRVYDIQDAGPHHRYAVSGRLVHNCNHALAYRVGAKKLASVLGMTEAEALSFIRNYQQAYPDVAKWQDDATKRGESGQITNDWGRTMQVERDRSFTQSSALLGQSGTASILVDGLIRMLRYDIRLIQWLAATVHDAIVMDIPDEHLEWAVPKIKELMECWWGPSDGTGQVIHFPVSSGQPADDWMQAGH